VKSIYKNIILLIAGIVIGGGIVGIISNPEMFKGFTHRSSEIEEYSTQKRDSTSQEQNSEASLFEPPNLNKIKVYMKFCADGLAVMVVAINEKGGVVKPEGMLTITVTKKDYHKTLWTKTETVDVRKKDYAPKTVRYADVIMTGTECVTVSFFYGYIYTRTQASNEVLDGVTYTAEAVFVTKTKTLRNDDTQFLQDLLEDTDI
jgi:hypothetical protein